MQYIIDTSSWLSLVRYYIPFDRDSIAYDFFKQKISKDTEDTFILLDRVLEECRYCARGLVVKKLNFIKLEENITKTYDTDLTAKYYRRVKNEFCYSSQKKNLNEAEFASRVERYMKSADSGIILKAIKLQERGDPITVVSEETKSDNDNKLFSRPSNKAIGY